MDIITVKMNQLYIKSLDKLVEMGMYPSRSEAIRVAIRDLLQKELWPEEGMPAKRELRAEASE
ncbi:MAG: ribbon-helix-helix protein, CopG family [Candidatus Lokiarchaeota archaeon]|nr:ribbon-helix-helix protein, CopG family [Candidatus Lokiarchaeota archaeon]